MSNSYLDKFRSKLPTTQGNQILNVLITKRDSGEIRTIDEFKAKLTELTKKLLEERITPTLELFQAIPGEDTSAEAYNEMLSHIEDDLTAAFTEADNIDEIIAAHQNIINDVSLKALRFGVNELESKISLYEFLNKSGKGFDDAQFNTFRESANLSTSRTDNNAALVYVDPQKGNTIDASEDAEIDFIGERAILASDIIRFLPIKGANWLTGPNSVRSELDVAFPNSTPANIIDGRNFTYWVVPILLSTPRTGGVPFEVCLDLASYQDINFIELEPATDLPMDLIGIDYFDGNGVRQTALETELSLRSPVRLYIDRVTSSCLVLRLRQTNYTEVQFKQRLGESNFHKALLQQTYLPIDLASISEDLKDFLTSDFIISDVLGLPSNTQSMLKYYQYLLGFDNVRLGFNSFKDRSIFVSKIKQVDFPGRIALKVIETRPVQNEGTTAVTIEEFNYPASSTEEDAKFYHGSIEYNLVTQFYGENNFLISSETIPILPLGARRVMHEQLVFIKKTSTAVSNNNMAPFRFFTDADATDVKVYRNGSLLNYGNSASFDWEFVGTGENIEDTDITLTTPGGGARMKRGIRLWIDPNPLDIYTVSYTPRVSNTDTVPNDTTLFDIIDLSGDYSVRSLLDNVVLFSSVKSAHVVERADIYLTIIFRRNSANLNVTPAVEEYMLITGSRNQDKFVGD